MTDGVEVKVLKSSGQSALVMYNDPKAEINPMACIIDRSHIGQAVPGSTVYISGDAIARSTAYGLDWSVFFPEGLSISAQEIHTVMYSKGILTLDDLVHRSSEIPDIVVTLSRAISIRLYNLVKNELGG